jgi:hypothetical protein
LVLADAWGNIIDEVTYTDSLPWPTTADGLGDFLILIDLDSDNSLGENWMAADRFVGVAEHQLPTLLTVMPNPTTGKVRVMSGKPIQDITLSDISGRTVLTQRGGKSDQTLDLSSLPAGIYFVRVVTHNQEIATAKVIKQ